MSIAGLRFGHVAFRVSDTERSVRWYADAFGAKKIYHAAANGDRPVEVTIAPLPPALGDRALLRVEEVNGQSPKVLHHLPTYENLTPLHPSRRVHLENAPTEIETRVIDLVTPLGFGQRALIVAPPRTGKTVLLQKITNAIAANHGPDSDMPAKVIVLLVDERPACLESRPDDQRERQAVLPQLETVLPDAAHVEKVVDQAYQVAELAVENLLRRPGRCAITLTDRQDVRRHRGYRSGRCAQLAKKSTIARCSAHCTCMCGRQFSSWPWPGTRFGGRYESNALAPESSDRRQAIEPA